MTDHIDAFPPQPAGKPRPTIAEIVMERAKPNMPAAEMLAALVPTIREHYPDMTCAQIDAAIRTEVTAWDAQMDGPEFWADFDDAVKLDPDWYETEDRCTCCRDGALHDTPQKLVAAYRAWTDATLPIEELAEAIIQRAIDACGINRRTLIPERPEVIERIAAAAMHLINAHPRRDELLKYEAEQARRAGKLGGGGR